MEKIFQAQNELSLQKMIHRDLKPQNIGLHFETLTAEMLSDEVKTAEFLRNFNFEQNDGYQILFFDLGYSDTLDENGFGAAIKGGNTLPYSAPE